MLIPISTEKGGEGVFGGGGGGLLANGRESSANSLARRNSTKFA